MPIRAIIFDVGDVILREKDHTKRFEWEQRLGLAPGQLTSLVQDSEPAAHAASGEVSERQVWEAVAVQLGLEAAQTLGMKGVLCRATQQTIADIQACLAEDS